MSTVLLPVYLTRAALAEAVACAAPTTLAEEDDLLGLGIELQVRRGAGIELEFGEGPRRRDGASGGVALRVRVDAAVSLRRTSRLFGTAVARGAVSLWLSTTLTLDGWELHSSTSLSRHHWLEEPELRLGGKRLGVGTVTSRIVDLLAERLTRRVDEELRQRDPLGVAVQRVVGELRNPRRLAGPLPLWVQVVPHSLGLGRLAAEAGGLRLTAYARFDLRLTSTPAQAPVSRTTPPNAGIPEGEPRFALALQVAIDYASLEALAARQLIGERFERLGQRTEIVDVAVGGVAGRLQLDIAIAGAATAKLRVTGVLGFEHPPGQVVLREATVSVTQANVLVRGLVRAFAKTIGRRIETEVARGSREQLRVAREKLGQRLAGGELAPGVTGAGQLDDLTVRELTAAAGGVLANAYASGALSLRVERLPAPPRQ